MTVFLLSVAGGLLACELWGSIDLIAKLAIRVLTVPLPEPRKGIRRAELAALVHPCTGERRVVALFRVVAVAGTLVISDIGHHRFRPVQSLELPLVWRAEDLFQEGTSSSERAPIAIAYLATMVFVALCFLASSTIAWLLGAAPWQIGLFWLLSPIGALGFSLLPIPAMVRILPVVAFSFAWAGLVLTLALLKGVVLGARGKLLPLNRKPHVPRG